MKNFIAGDIGGTKTLSQINTAQGVLRKSYPSAGCERFGFAAGYQLRAAS